MKTQTRSRSARVSMVAGLVAGLLCVTQAQAGVVTMYYDSFGGFLEGSESPSVAGGDPADVSNLLFSNPEVRDPNTPDAYKDVAWGLEAAPGSGQSSLTLSGYEDQSVQTNSGILVPFGDLAHYNNQIGGVPLAGIEISWNLSLYETLADATADTNAVHELNATFGLDVWETPNGGTCGNASPAGTVVGTGVHGSHFIADGTQAPGNPCDDPFAFTPIAGFTDTFMLHGEEYELVLSGFWTEADGGTLTETFWSPEHIPGQPLDPGIGYVRFELREVEVPVSGPLSLMVIGLAGMGLATRRRSTPK